MLRSSRALRVVSVALSLIGVPAIGVAGESNGATRGGGNALVCFRDLRWASADSKPHEIPDEALASIESIRMLDLVQAQWSADDHRRPLAFPPASGDLELAYARVIDRFRDAVPRIHARLAEAARQLPLSALTRVARPVEQVVDIPMTVPVPRGCAITTIFNQWPDDDTGAGKWEADSRLLDHSRHGFESRLSALLHERAYWVARVRRIHIESEAGPVYGFVHAALERDVTYRRALQTYNDLFWNRLGMAQEMVQLRETGPVAWFAGLMARLQSSGARDLGELRRAYDRGFRSEVLAHPLLDAPTRQQTDRALRRYFETGDVDPEDRLRGWPADFASSALPPIAGR